MKKLFLLKALLCLSFLLHAQEQAEKTRLPLKVTILSESIGLPSFRNFFRRPNFGLRVGTELYYRQNAGHQLFQTINIGFYKHRNFHSALFVSSEFGYRKFIDKAFVDATLGAGCLLLHSTLPRYKMEGNEYVRASNLFARLMPTLGLGAGYQFQKNVSVFSRYEMFGEMPFGYSGIPALPHKTLHLGAKINLK